MGRKHIKVACSFVATQIGAGFASGQEIALFFSGCNIIIPLLSACICGLLCFVFAEAGRIFKKDIVIASFERFALPIRYTIRLVNLATYCAMLAGCEFVIFSLFDIHGGALLSALLCLFIQFLGVEKLKILNTLSLPVIIIIVTLVYIKSDVHLLPTVRFPVSAAILYATMNIISAGYLISSMTTNFTAKDNAKISLLVAAMLLFLICCIFSVINANCDKTMPFLYMSNSVGIGKLASFALYLSVFTTMSSSLYIASDKNNKQAILMTCLGLVLSCFGFKAIVDFCYPIFGYVGALITCVITYKLICKRKSQSNPLFLCC